MRREVSRRGEYSAFCSKKCLIRVCLIFPKEAFCLLPLDFVCVPFEDKRVIPLDFQVPDNAAEAAVGCL